MNLLVVVGKWARLLTVTKWMRCYVIALAVIVTTVAASCSMRIWCRHLADLKYHKKGNQSLLSQLCELWTVLVHQRQECGKQNDAVICDVAAHPHHQTRRLLQFTVYPGRCDFPWRFVANVVVGRKNTLYEFVHAYAGIVTTMDKNPVVDGCVI